MKYDESYQDSATQLPNRDRPEEEKQEQYHKQWAKAIYSKYYNNKTGIPRDFQSDIDLLRQYGKGNQPESIYKKNKTGGTTGTTSTDVDVTSNGSLSSIMDGRDNIDWTIVSIAPRIKSMVKAYLESAREDMFVDAIDADSGAKAEDAKWRLWAYSKNQAFIMSMQAQAGIQPQKPSFVPTSKEELEAYEAMGGFKLNFAKAMEKLVKYTMGISGYDDELEEKLLDDLMDIGIGITRTHLDPEDNMFKDEWIDPKYFVVQYSEHNDFRDSEYAGHSKQYSISQARLMFPRLDESDFEGAAYSYCSKNGNPSNDEWSKYKVVNDDGSRGYDSFLVDVFHCEWVDTKMRRKLSYTGRHGHKTMVPLKGDDEVKPLSERDKRRGISQKEIKSNLRKLRMCTWFIGTDFVGEWGAANFQDRPKKNKVLHNYHVRCLPDASIISQLKPVFDNLQIGWIRYQDARARALKAGVAINFDKLKNIEDVRGKYSVSDVLKMFVKDGILFYRESLRGKYEGGKSLPIEHLPSNILQDIQEFTAMWDHSFVQMEGLTGISPLMLGASPDPDATLGSQKLSISSSSNAIKPLGLAMNMLKRKGAESLMRRLQLAFKAREDIAKNYIGVIGEADVEVLKIAEKSGVKYGLFPTMRPSEQEKINIIQAADQSLANRREGRPGIDLQTNLYIKNQIAAGANLKELSFLIGYYEKKIGEEDQKRKMQMIQAQGKENKEMAAQQGQMEMQKKQAELEAELKIAEKNGQFGIFEKLVSKTPQEAMEMVALLRGLGLNLKDPQQGAQPPTNGTSPPSGGNVPPEGQSAPTEPQMASQGTPQ